MRLLGKVSNRQAKFHCVDSNCSVPISFSALSLHSIGLNQLTMRMSSQTLTVTDLGAVTIRRSAVAAGPGLEMGGIWDWWWCPPAFGFISTGKLKSSVGAHDEIFFWLLFLDFVGYRDNFEKGGLVPLQKKLVC